MSMRKTVILTIFGGFFFMLGFFWNYHRPQIKKWLLIRLEQISTQKLPVRLLAEDAEISLIPPRLTIKNLRFLPQEVHLRRILAPGSVEQVDVWLGVGSLLRGQIRISNVTIKRPQVKVILHESLNANSAKTGTETSSIPLQQIAKIPIDDIVIEQGDLMLGMTNPKIALHIRDFDVSLLNRYRSFYVEANTPELFVKELGKAAGIPFEVETRFLLEPEELNITALKIKRDQSFIVAAGIVRGPIEEMKFNEADVKLRVASHLPEIQSFLDVLKPGMIIPRLKGKTTVDLGFTITPQKLDPEVRFRLKTEDVKVSKYILGNVNAEGVVNRKRLDAETITAQTRAALVELHQTHLDFLDGGKVTVRSNVEIKKAQLQPLLEDLNVKEVPVKLGFTAALPCEGDIAPKFQLRCKGEVKAENLKVFDDMKEDFQIVGVKNFSGAGELTVDLDKVDYIATAKMGQRSSGRTTGHIEYEKGFAINYEAEALDFKDIEQLANLKLEGSAKLKGSTEGDARRATLDLDLNAQDVWLENYELGHIQGHAGYREGVLSLKKLNGNIRNSRFNGDVAIQLLKKEISLDVVSPYIEIEDIAHAFSRKYTLPIRASGTGTGEVKGHGPLSLSQMTYSLRSSFYRGDLAGEGFDELKFNVSAKNGHVQADHINLIKGASVVNMTGTITPQAMIDAKILGNGFHLEQSESLDRLGINITGLFNFNVNIKGELPSPDIEMNGQLQKVVAGERAMEDSGFHLHMKKDRFEGQGQFLGGAVQTRFIFPLDNKAPYEFFLKTNHWDFTHFFALLNESSRQKDFETYMTATVDLKAPQGGFWNSTGRIEVEDVLLKRGSLSLQNSKPLVISLQNGLMRTQFFQLTGENAFLKLETLSSSREQVDVRLNGHFDLNLLSLLTPFMSDLRGNINLTMTAKGSVDNPTVQGTAYVERGFIRFRDFPHAFEEIRADLLFAKRTLQVSSLHANLGGGKITADGKVGFIDLGNVPVDVTGSFDNVSLNVPDGFRSHGSGKMQIKGSNFPYLLVLQYDVESGNVTREFSTGPSLTRQVQPSSFLPRFLDRENFEPLKFDLAVNLKNPVVVKNSLIDGTMLGQIKLLGTPSQAKLTGRLQMQKTSRIFFRDTPFDVITGNVEYQSDSPDNPLLYIQGRARVTETSTDTRPQTYDIDLIAQGHPKNSSDLKISLSSQPALSQQQIVSLLALGITNTTSATQLQRNTDQQSSALATQGSVQLGTALLQKPIGKEIKNRLGVDMQISSTYTQAEAGTVPKVTFNKQWTPKFIGSASRTIERSPTNLVKLQYKMNKNLSLIGSWEGRSTDTSGGATGNTYGSVFTQPQRDPTPSILGLDLEYKIEFR